MMQLHIGELKKSESDLQQAKLIETSNQNLNLYWAKHYFFQNDTLNYIEKLMDYIEVHPKDPEPYYLLANFHYSIKNWNKASIYFATCITLLEGSEYYISDNLGNPIHIAKIYSTIGDYCRTIGEIDLMYTYYDKAIESIDTFTFELVELSNEIQEKLKESCGKECTITPSVKYK
jgi:tetratricopeptide (TPR) repeat protein